MSATFSLRYFTVTINQPSNGRISVYNNYDSSTHTTTFNAAYGSVIRTTVSANTGYSFGSLTINGTSQSNNGNYTIVANTTISATVNINYYTVSCTQPANGSLRYSYGGSEHSSGSVPYNGSVKVIARANSGYSVSAVYKNGSSIGNNSSTNITGNTTFTANMSYIRNNTFIITMNIGTDRNTVYGYKINNFGSYTINRLDINSLANNIMELSILSLGNVYMLGLRFSIYNLNYSSITLTANSISINISKSRESDYDFIAMNATANLSNIYNIFKSSYNSNTQLQITCTFNN